MNDVPNSMNTTSLFPTPRVMQVQDSPMQRWKVILSYISNLFLDASRASSMSSYSKPSSQLGSSTSTQMTFSPAPELKPTDIEVHMRRVWANWNGYLIALIHEQRSLLCLPNVKKFRYILSSSVLTVSFPVFLADVWATLLVYLSFLEECFTWSLLRLSSFALSSVFSW